MFASASDMQPPLRSRTVNALTPWMAASSAYLGYAA